MLFYLIKIYKKYKILINIFIKVKDFDYNIKKYILLLLYKQI